MEMLHSGYNSSVDVSQLDSILSSLQPLDFVILVVKSSRSPRHLVSFLFTGSSQAEIQHSWS
jgi:hypothetical protein